MFYVVLLFELIAVFLIISTICYFDKNKRISKFWLSIIILVFVMIYEVCFLDFERISNAKWHFQNICFVVFSILPTLIEGNREAKTKKGE